MSDRETRKNEMFSILYSPGSGEALRKAASDYVNGLGPNPYTVPELMLDRKPVKFGPQGLSVVEVVREQTGEVLGAFERPAQDSSSLANPESWDTPSRLDDGPAMHVKPTAPTRQWVEIGYDHPIPQDILEQTRIYHDSIVEAVWNPERGHISKTELETALRNMAGYAYQRGYESGWKLAAIKAKKLIEKLLP